MIVDIRPVAFTQDEFAPLLAEAEAHGGVFLLRLRDEWHSGQNRFCRDGEFLLGVWLGGALVGVGGVSLDPYDPAPGLGRVRHVYVARAQRRHSIGRALMERIIGQARGSFDWLRLRTRTAEAARLYEKLGFVRSDRPGETHRLTFQISSQMRP